MNPFLETIMKDDSTCSVLFQRNPSFLSKLLFLFWGPLVDVLHHAIWATFWGQPNTFRFQTINTLKDALKTIIGSKIKTVPNGQSVSGPNVSCDFTHRAGQNTFRATSNFQ